MLVTGGGPDRDAAPLPGCKVLLIRGQAIPRTCEFRYIGSVLGSDRSLGVEQDVRRRISLAWAAFGLLKHIWKSRSVSRSTKARLLMACVASVLLFGSEYWTLLSVEKQLLRKTWNSMVRHVMQVKFVPGGGWYIRDCDGRILMKVPSLDTMLAKRSA